MTNKYSIELYIFHIGDFVLLNTWVKNDSCSLEMDFFWGGQEKRKLHEIKDGHGDGAMLVISYPSPNWVNMNICTSRASLGNKNKMYIVEVNRPSYHTTLSSQA